MRMRSQRHERFCGSSSTCCGVVSIANSGLPHDLQKRRVVSFSVPQAEQMTPLGATSRASSSGGLTISISERYGSRLSQGVSVAPFVVDGGTQATVVGSDAGSSHGDWVAGTMRGGWTAEPLPPDPPGEEDPDSVAQGAGTTGVAVVGFGAGVTSVTYGPADDGDAPPDDPAGVDDVPRPPAPDEPPSGEPLPAELPAA